MADVLIVYDSGTGNTEEMAEAVAEGVRNGGGEAEIKRVKDANPEDMLDADGVIVGSPTYYGQMSGPLKQFFDDSVTYQGQLSGTAGGAFSSSANPGGGNETTVLGILECMLIHGMVIQGTANGDHYGPVAISSPDERAIEQCHRLGKRVTQLADRLSS